MLASLTRLVLDNNLLRKLPDVVLQLPSLAVLQAAGNTITHLPECLEQMRSLQGLILSTNQVCSAVAWEGMYGSTFTGLILTEQSYNHCACRPDASANVHSACQRLC